MPRESSAGLNSYVEAGSDPAYEDPYTEPCRKCDGEGAVALIGHFGKTRTCAYCDGTGRVECERPSKEDFYPEDED